MYLIIIKIEVSFIRKLLNLLKIMETYYLQYFFKFDCLRWFSDMISKFLGLVNNCNKKIAFY